MRLFRIIPFLLLLGLSRWSSAQNIVNGSFEEWEKREHFKPDSWYTPTRNVSLTHDSKQGKSAIKLENSISATGAKYYSYAYNRYLPLGLRGFAFTDEALSVVFWAKYDLAPGDSARILVYMREDNTTKGYVNFKLWGSTNNNYVKHSIPIFWYNSRTPDTTWIYLYSYTETDVNGPGYIIFDDLHFENIGVRGADLTNQGFEQWTDYSIDYPRAWRSLDLLYYDNYKAFLTERSVFKSEDAVQGKYSLKLTNYLNGYPRNSYIYIGSEDDDYYTPVFKVYKRYAYLQGYYKLVSDEPDSAYIRFRTYHEGGNLSIDGKYFEPTDEWTFFSIPINYYNSNTPDSASIIAYSSVGTIKSANTAFYLDALDLVMEPFTLDIQDLKTQYKIYPNPAEGIVSTTLPEAMNLVVYDILGKERLIRNLNVGDSNIDVSDLPAGIYHFKFYNQHTQWQKTIIIK